MMPIFHCLVVIKICPGALWVCCGAFLRFNICADVLAATNILLFYHFLPLAMARVNRPSLMVYGGTIRAGCGAKKQPLGMQAFSSSGIAFSIIF